MLFVGGLMSYVIGVCLCIVVSNTRCVVFLVCCLRLVLPFSLGCPFLIATLVFSNVCLLEQISSMV
jgi:hypothetical protein